METTLKQFRKALGLSQEEVGRRVGVTGVAISRIESGDRALTDRMALALCKEFNVDYGWLTTGQGEMFVNTDDALGGIVDSIMQGDNTLAKSIFKGFAQFSEEDWARLRDLIDKFLAGAVPAEIMERYMDDAAIQRMEDGLGKNNAAFMYGYAVGLGEREKKEKDGDQ
jgi:transcriptional regulator with XRE-family HTH domain